ncbi:hypothetical protein MMC10_008424 [Thelotrema lepadinum]|nr:hypothetical protein [Thelotrema lepadinum]
MSDPPGQRPPSPTLLRPTQAPDSWSTAAKFYDETVAPNARAVTPQLIALAHSLRPLDAPGASVLEFGAGTGALTHALRRKYPGTPVLATDVAVGMLGRLEVLEVEKGGSVVRLGGEGKETGEGTGKGTGKGTGEGGGGEGGVEQPLLRTQILDMTNPLPGLASTAKEDSHRGTTGRFSHVFCSQALQTVGYPSDTIARWIDELLLPGGVLAVVSWDYDEECGAMETWRRAAKVVLGPEYVDPRLLPRGAWDGRKEHEEGIRALGRLEGMKVEGENVGFRIGGEKGEGSTEGFLKFWWESDNPVARERIEGRGEEERARLREEMGRVLREDYDHGRKMPQSSVLLAGRKKMG